MKSFQFGTVGKRPTGGTAAGGGTIVSSSSASKKDLEEQKKKLEEQAAAEAFEEYVAVFQDTSGSKAASKVWIKAGTYDAGKRQEDTKEKGKLYKPTSRFEKDGIGGGGGGDLLSSSSSSSPAAALSSSSGANTAAAAAAATAASTASSYDLDRSRPDKPGAKKKQNEKKKSNLEIFKEELKIIQEEREERHRLKRMLGLQADVIKLPPKPGDDLRASLSLELDDARMGSIDDGDPHTTNIYLGNLPTKISEQQLMEVFGKYGPLASVKVMWPRTEEEKARNRLSGFVAFMSRRDGERALKNLTGKEILGSEIKLGWGKAVPIPAYPVYIPPGMLEMTMPPPLSGLPFNAQVDRRERHRLPPPGTPLCYPTEGKAKDDFDRMLSTATVKVVMPTDRALLALIHRMVEFVIREGPMFEAMIMNKEINNPQFRFLFENQSPAHVYYRWKLYSLLQGDSTSRWRIEEFRMFKDGSVWRPPKLNPFTQGMPDELIPEEEREIRVGSLSNAQRNRLERMLRRITPDRHRVAEVMIFSIEHSESTDEICACLRESLINDRTSLQKKIARLYVVNDVLHNCTAKGMNAFGYRKAFKAHLPAIFQELHYSYSKAPGGSTGSADKENTNAESFKQRVMGCFKAWDEWGVYSNEFLIRLQNIFLGLASFKDEPQHSQRTDSLDSGDYDDPNNRGGDHLTSATSPNSRHHRNNSSSSDEETARTNLNVHRQKLHKKSAPPRAQLPPQSAMKLVKSLQSTDPEINEELDGVPMDVDEMMMMGGGIGGGLGDDGLGNPGSSSSQKAKFIPSKWEELDPEEVKAQAVTTTSKWDLFEEQRRAEEEAKKLQQQLKEQMEQEEIEATRKSEEQRAVAVAAAHAAAAAAAFAASTTAPVASGHDSRRRNKAGKLVGYGEEEEDGGGYGGGGGGVDEEDIDGMPMDEDEVVGTGGGGTSSRSEEERRAKLREVEMKVLAFQDELERRGVVAGGGGGVDIVREYREKLLRKVFEPRRGSDRTGGSSRRRSISNDSDGEDSSRGDRRSSRRRRSRSRSPHQQHHRRSSRSPDDSTAAAANDDYDDRSASSHQQQHHNRRHQRHSSRSGSRHRSSRQQQILPTTTAADDDDNNSIGSNSSTRRRQQQTTTTSSSSHHHSSSRHHSSIRNRGSSNNNNNNSSSSRQQQQRHHGGGGGSSSSEDYYDNDYDDDVAGGGGSGGQRKRQRSRSRSERGGGVSSSSNRDKR